jgi:hypothetical protein
MAQFDRKRKMQEAKRRLLDRLVKNKQNQATHFLDQLPLISEED